MIGHISSQGVPALLRELRDTGPQDRIPAFFEQHYIQAWYGMTLPELRTVLDAAPENELRKHALAAYVRSVLRGEPAPPEPDSAQADTGTGHNHARAMTTAMAILESRFRGALRVAVSLLDDLQPDAVATNALVDGSMGAASFLAVQAGITRMLAGDLRAALADFERAKWTDPPADLAFLVRDAHAKAALIHALAGDPVLARRELDDAARCARTDSWAELSVDATVLLAESMLCPEEEGLAALLSIPRRDIGEMWPFYLLAAAPAALAGHAGAEHLLTVLEQSSLPGSESGEGLPGSAGPLVRAALAEHRSDSRSSRANLAAADQQIPIAALASAGASIDAGAPAQALSSTAMVVPQTLGLRQLELWRMSIVARAHDALGQTASAEAARGRAAELAAGLTRINLPIGGPVGSDVRALLDGGRGGVTRPAHRLTPREFEVLTHVALGLTRKEIADRLFVSLNTIKTQVSSLYRKLGVSNRDALLGEAYDRGLL